MWFVSEMECDICGRCWVLVAPVGMIEAECPGCLHFNPIPGCWDAQEEAGTLG